MSIHRLINKIKHFDKSILLTWLIKAIAIKKYNHNLYS